VWATARAGWIAVGIGTITPPPAAAALAEHSRARRQRQHDRLFAGPQFGEVHHRPCRGGVRSSGQIDITLEFNSRFIGM